MSDTRILYERRPCPHKGQPTCICELTTERKVVAKWYCVYAPYLFYGDPCTPEEPHDGNGCHWAVSDE